MSETLSIPEKISISKGIQEISIKGEEPPPEYVVKETTFGIGCLKSSPPRLYSVPIIDISLLPSKDELDKLRSASSTVGCFQVIGHGVSCSFLDKIRGVGKEFLALPEEEKQRYGRAANETEGYGTNLDSRKQVLDWCHRLTLRVLPKDQRRLSLWPDNPSDFSEVADEFTTLMKCIMDLLLKNMARSLDLEENSFVDQFGERSMMQIRFNYYPSCSRPDLVIGVKPHTDRSGITVLLQDKEVEGLQILLQDKWVKVPVIPYALLVNIGDQMEILSNGIFKSITHRVVTNKETGRMSVTIFNEPNPEKEIGPADGLIDETRPRLYKNVKDYGPLYSKYYREGKRAIDTLKMDYNSN